METIVIAKLNKKLNVGNTVKIVYKTFKTSHMVPNNGIANGNISVRSCLNACYYCLYFMGVFGLVQ